MATGEEPRGKGAADATSQAIPERTAGATTAVDFAADTAAATPAELAASASGPSPPRTASRSEESLVGSVLEQRYEITRQIGQGGMGAVYEATHKLIGKRVAVKVLLDKFAEKDSLVARLEQEARLASSIGHPNIIDITDFGQTGDGRTFVVMEFLEGESLGAAITRDGKLEIARAIRIGRQIASALAAAHDKGVVHRDLKPENVFLVNRGDGDFVKVVDFGISKLMRPEAGHDTPRLTQTGMVLGTPLYMSPEQARGDEDLDHRIDIYALGVILFEMVTGEVPFRGSNYLNILSQVVSDAPPSPRSKNPAVTAELEAIIFKGLEKDPAHRYQTMAEAGDDLAILMSLEGSAASTGARISAMRRRGRRGGRRLPLPLLIGSIAVILGVAVTMNVLWKDAPPASTSAEAPTSPAPPIASPAERVVTPPAEAAAPAVKTVTLTIDSIPPGAIIYQGDLLVGPAPQQRTLVRESKEVVFYLEKGRLSATLKINPLEEVDRTKPLEVRLTRGRAPRPRTGGVQLPAIEATQPDDTAGGDLTGKPSAYKETPTP